jgi:hypothetical protein
MKVTVFDRLINAVSDFHFNLRGWEFEITTTYTYLGVHFMGTRFSLRLLLNLNLARGKGLSLDA